MARKKAVAKKQNKLNKLNPLEAATSTPRSTSTSSGGTRSTSSSKAGPSHRPDHHQSDSESSSSEYNSSFLNQHVPKELSKTPAKTSNASGRALKTPAKTSNASGRKSKTPAKRSNSSGRASMTTKHRRFRPGARALKEIRKFQRSTECLIPRLPFSRVVRQVLMEEETTRASLGRSFDGLRIQTLALEALHESCELFLADFFSDAYYCTLHAKRVTLMVADFHLARRIRGRSDILNP